MFSLSPFRNFDLWDVDPLFDMDRSHQLAQHKSGKKKYELLKMDIQEKPKEYLMHFNVPGVKKENINVHVEKRVLTVSATYENKAEDDKDEEGVKFHWKERSTGSATRNIELPANINVEKLTAKTADGVLEITIPKEEAKSERKSIAIN
eukprot:snap_masked-scaffold_4-processed-gene-12.27-mRNA-1 protein AED:0.55 eAED:0.55 QI:0/-1/0/1/-1/1/1/0/148